MLGGGEGLSYRASGRGLQGARCRPGGGVQRNPRNYSWAPRTWRRADVQCWKHLQSLLYQGFPARRCRVRVFTKHSEWDQSDNENWNIVFLFLIKIPRSCFFLLWPMQSTSHFVWGLIFFFFFFYPSGNLKTNWDNTLHSRKCHVWTCVAIMLHPPNPTASSWRNLFLTYFHSQGVMSSAVFTLHKMAFI